MEEDKCGFCHTGEETDSICGTLHKDKVDGKAVVAHHKCMQYSAMLVQYKFEEFGGFKKQEVLKEIFRGNRLQCFLCKKEKSKKKNGAASGCSLSSCRKTFHYYCVAMNPDTVAKRYRVAAGNKVVILYRVFCCKAHEEKYRQNISAEDIVGKNTSDDEDDEGHEEADDEDKQSGSGDGPDRTSPDNNQHGDTEDEQPEKKKRKTEDETNDDVSDPESPGMSQGEVILETHRQYKALQNMQRVKRQHTRTDDSMPFLLQSTSYRSDTPISPQVTNGLGHMYDSADDLTEGFNTSNNCSTDSETYRSEFLQFASEKHQQGCTLVIPSKLDVDFKSLCTATGLQPANCLFWPSSNKMKGLQDRHMYYCMWDLLTHLREKNADGVGSVLRNACCEKYESFYNFDVHNKHSSSIRTKLQDICVILHNQQELQACRLERVSVQNTNIDVLIVSLSQTLMKHLDSLILYLWTTETFRTRYDDSLSFLSQEKKIISSWLLPRLQDKAIELSVYPKDDTIRRSYNRKTCSVARDIEFRVETIIESFKDSPELVRVTVIRNIDDGTVQFRPYMHKLILSVVQQTAGFDCYCVIDLQQTADVRCVYDFIPPSMSPHDFDVYSAWNPSCRPVSCVVIHKPKEASVVAVEPRRSPSPVMPSLDDSEQFILYLDVDEDQTITTDCSCD